MKLPILLLFVLLSSLSFGQATYSSVLVSKDDSERIKSAIILALPSGTRTYSKADGSFEVALNPQDTIIRIEHLGYVCHLTPRLDPPDTISLEANRVLLPEVNLEMHALGLGYNGPVQLSASRLGSNAQYPPGLWMLLNGLAEIIAADTSFSTSSPKSSIDFTVTEEGVVEDIRVPDVLVSVEQAIRDYFHSTDTQWMPAEVGGQSFKQRFRIPVAFEKVFTMLDRPASFDGGIQGFFEYINNNLAFPLDARMKGLKGQVYVQMTVEKDGTITDVKAVKGMSCTCDQEAVRLLEQSPKWIPGRQKKTPVRQRMVQQVYFR